MIEGTYKEVKDRLVKEMVVSPEDRLSGTYKTWLNSENDFDDQILKQTDNLVIKGYFRVFYIQFESKQTNNATPTSTATLLSVHVCIQ